MTELYEIDEHTNRVSKEILDTCFYIHTKLGPGLLERVYEDCLFHFLLEKNIKVERQKQIPIMIDNFKIPTSLNLDLIVEDRVIIELKSVEKMLPIHEAQLHTYLKLSNRPLGLLINFNVTSLKNGIKRIAMSRTNQRQNFA